MIALPAAAAAAGEIGQEGSGRRIYVMNIQIGDSPMESSSSAGPPHIFSPGEPDMKCVPPTVSLESSFMFD